MFNFFKFSKHLFELLVNTEMIANENSSDWMLQKSINFQVHCVYMLLQKMMCLFKTVHFKWLTSFQLAFYVLKSIYTWPFQMVTSSTLVVVISNYNKTNSSNLRIAQCTKNIAISALKLRNVIVWLTSLVNIKWATDIVFYCRLKRIS